MDIKSQLESSLGRRDEQLNIELAIKIAKENEIKSESELIELLKDKSTQIQNDAIKVLYEIGNIKILQ